MSESANLPSPPVARAAGLERLVLGMMLDQPSHARAVAMPLLTLNDFYELKHRIIYQAIVGVAAKGADADHLTVTELLRQTQQLDNLGGAYAIASMALEAPYNANLEQYCRSLNEHRAKRELRGHAQAIMQALVRDEDIFDVLAAGEKAFTTISQSFVHTKLRTLKQTAQEAYAYLEHRFRNPGQARVSFGIRTLDNVVGGLEPGDAVVIGARPGMGKSDAMVHIARHNGLVNALPGAVFSLEMTAVQLGFRFLSHPSGVPANAMRRTITTEALGAVGAAAEQMENGELIVLDDNPSQTLASLRAALMQAKVKHPDLAWAFVDYLQLIRGSGKGNTVEVIEEISRGLKAVAKELGLVLFELAQLNREVDKRSPPVPVKTDLRGGGQIEQDADVIIFLYRPDYYGLNQDSAGDFIAAGELDQFIEFIVEKNRHDKPAVAIARYHPAESRFDCFPQLEPNEEYRSTTRFIGTKSEFDGEGNTPPTDSNDPGF